MSALSSLATQFGGLASLAGVSVSGDSRRSESVAVLQSEALTEQYIQANNLLPVLFREKVGYGEREVDNNRSDRDPNVVEG